MKEFFSKSKNGIDVFIDTERCHALTHFAKNPKLADLVKELITTLTLAENITRVEHDFGEEIGKTDLIETSSEDVILYALRPLRSDYSRFVKNKESTPTTWITTDVRKMEEEYFLYTAFVGRPTPSFPGGDYLPEQSKDFWSRHALVWGSQEIIPGTVTTECPW